MNKQLLAALGIIIAISLAANIFLVFQVKNKTAQLAMQDVTIKSQQDNIAQLTKQLAAKPQVITVTRIIKSTSTATTGDITETITQISAGFIEQINMLEAQITELNKKLATVNTVPVDKPRKWGLNMGMDVKSTEIGADYKILPNIHVGAKLNILDSGVYFGPSARIDF
jgi:small-conductance mechanosensitive channel